MTENQQALQMTHIASDILSSMMDAFASIISNNLNVVMKFLTSVTIVLSIPTIFFGYYGMNVQLPMMQHPIALLGILGATMIVMLAVVLMFWRRDWF